MALWDDIGPLSQGKIMTDILQGRYDDAKAKLARWTEGDLRTLGLAGEMLLLFIARELAPRPAPKCDQNHTVAPRIVRRHR